MAKSSSEDFDQWAFVIDRHRRAPHGKTDMLNGSSDRSDENALIILWLWASGTSDMCCCHI
jgi:hypothetical protein